MEKVTFDVGTQPWDSIVGQKLEGIGVGPYPGWQDSLTGTKFNIVLGQMWVEPITQFPSNRILILNPAVGISSDKTILRIRFSSPQKSVRFTVNMNVQYGPMTVDFYLYPSYGTGGRPSNETLVKKISFGPVQNPMLVEYVDDCRSITEIWLTIVGYESNIDNIEFNYIGSWTFIIFKCFILKPIYWTINFLRKLFH